MSVIGKLKGLERVDAVGGHVVRTPREEHPYKVVLEYEGAHAVSEHPVATIREGEALIRQRSPRPPEISRMREWNSL